MIVDDPSNRPPMNLYFTGHNIMSPSRKIQNAVWNSEKKAWMHRWCVEDIDGSGNFFEKENTRNSGIFILYKAQPVESALMHSDLFPNFKVLCNDYIGKYTTVHPDWEDGYIDPIFRPGGFGAPYGAEIHNENHNLSHQKWRVVYDGAPFFYIAFTNLVDLNKLIEYPINTDRYIQETEKYEISLELENLYISQHPFYAARTLGELFKLIMDWDICYNEFNNRENIAVLCHNVMRAVNMPQNVYDSIYNSLPDTCIAKYLKGIENFDQYGDKGETPNCAIEWFKEKYWDLQSTLSNSPNIENTDEFYYRKRVLFTR